MNLRFYIDPDTREPHLHLHGVSEEEVQERIMSTHPPGWDEERVRRVLDRYEPQTDEEALAEDEATYEATTHTTMGVPVDLVRAVRGLIAKRSEPPG